VFLGTCESVLLALATLALTTAIGGVVLVIGAAVAEKRYSALAHVFDVVSTPLLIPALLVVAAILAQQPLLGPFGVLSLSGDIIRLWAQPSSWGNDLTNGAGLLMTLFLVGEVARLGYLLFRSVRPAQAGTVLTGHAPRRSPELLAVLGPAAVTGSWIAGDAVLMGAVLEFDWGIGPVGASAPLGHRPRWGIGPVGASAPSGHRPRWGIGPVGASAPSRPSTR
jgi:hypothetical protein